MACPLGPAGADRSGDFDSYRVALELRRDPRPSRGARVGEEHADTGHAVTQADGRTDHARQRHERVGMCREDLSDRLGSHGVRRVAGAPARAAGEQAGEQERRDRVPDYGLFTLIVVPLLSPSGSWLSVRT